MEVAVTCCAGDAACPIAVAMALLRAPILTVTEEDDEWENCGCEVFVAISYKHTSNSCCATPGCIRYTAHHTWVCAHGVSAVVKRKSYITRTILFAPEVYILVRRYQRNINNS